MGSPRPRASVCRGLDAPPVVLGLVVARDALDLIARSEDDRDALMQAVWLNAHDAFAAVGVAAEKARNTFRAARQCTA